MNSPKKTALLLTIALVSGVCSACSPLTLAGRVTGNVAGEEVAEATANPDTTVVVESEGGEFCPVMEALGWPPAKGEGPALVRPLDANPLARPVFGALDHGSKHCGWAE